MSNEKKLEAIKKSNDNSNRYKKPCNKKNNSQEEKRNLHEKPHGDKKGSNDGPQDTGDCIRSCNIEKILDVESSFCPLPHDSLPRSKESSEKRANRKIICVECKNILPYGNKLKRRLQKKPCNKLRQKNCKH